MSDPVGNDPELDLAELCLDAADRAEAHFEYLSQRADEAPTPKLRDIRMRADADDLLWDYDDGA
jgi:hypothetical protein